MSTWADSNTGARSAASRISTRRRGTLRASLLMAVLLCGLISTRFVSEAEEASANSATSDDAHPPVNVANLDNVPVEIWGVSGQTPSQTQTPSLEVLVWDIQQVGNRVFVGGGFLNVQENRDATPIPQAYLAAFDLNTGEWISTCTPTFDRIVYALTVNPRGMLLVGGEFTQVNGTAREGLVALDPDTCQIDPGFAGALERPWSTKRAMARELEVVNGELYVVGNFSHVNGPNGQRERVYKSARMNANWGTLDPNWKPEVAGSSIWGVAVDEARNRVHFAGYFTSVNGLADSGYFHTVDMTTGASVTGLNPLLRNYTRSQPEMFDVAMGIDTVFVAGEQHIVQILDADDHTMLGFNHTGNYGCAQYGWDHFRYCNAFTGGAYQVAERIGDVVFSGCHCTRDSVNGNLTLYDSYSDARYGRKVIMAHNATTGELIPSFDPDATVVKDGAWAVASDTNGCLYIGGDYDNRGVDAQLGSWAGGFVKLCEVGWTPPEPDTEGPTTPTNLAAVDVAPGAIELSWTASTDPSGVDSYLVFRDGVYVGWTDGNTTTFNDTGLTPFAAYVYAVRAVDTIGNESATSDPLTVWPGGEDTEPPTVPTGLDATDLGAGAVGLTWNPSTDNVGIQSYLVYRNGAYLAWTNAATTSYTDSGLTEGVEYLYQVRAVDLSSNQSDKTAPFPITPGGADTEPPTVPADLTATDEGGGTVSLTWSPSTDNIGMQSYLVYRNGSYIAWTNAATTSYIDAGLTEGVEYLYQVRAVDLASNQSDKTPPIPITPGGPDTEPPTIPADLAATDLGGGSVEITWTASTDNIGMQSYLVYRNGAYVGWTDAATTTFTDTGLTDGVTYSWEVRAVDLAGNRSAKSSPVTLLVGP